MRRTKLLRPNYADARWAALRLHRNELRLLGTQPHCSFCRDGCLVSVSEQILTGNHSVPFLQNPLIAAPEAHNPLQYARVAEGHR
jgi:hypothetical protein